MQTSGNGLIDLSLRIPIDAAASDGELVLRDLEIGGAEEPALRDAIPNDSTEITIRYQLAEILGS